ncbi:DMSO/TMAO reductase YedYZ molybdopterin-dependent catalytic subunit [Actinocorallia herbida]|uniref:DMSO/TMAO reductase YedYZ molybdopterin-dependent catalytic subunit n=1 Tax=Actinocorallia herbida TaxID=58109 RepID=A0A3N1CZ75_9ACTN|nr:sulfite oxidase-like oxidoreductase [Actinocorallia herbida]ROO86526.1 DMSO/TMAO reductase YedYZ molybdopterin-dependent catalytic subunit [Actinocorallia herbida]
MNELSPGFHGRPRTPSGPRLPPGQYLTTGFPVLSAGPTPTVTEARWRFTIETETGAERVWTWAEMLALPQEDVRADIHCVTRWSKFDTRWRGVSLDVLLDGIETEADYALAYSYGGYSTNLPLADLTGGKAWLVHAYGGEPLEPEHGGPARLLVPHLYFWKSAKWLKSLRLTTRHIAGFWETDGYHDYGDPWREQRLQGD